MAPATLAELVCAIDEGLVSGKIGKQVLPMLLQVRPSGDRHQAHQQCLHLYTLQEYAVSVCGCFVRLYRAKGSLRLYRVRERMA